MKTRRVRYQDGRQEIIRILSQENLDSWSRNEPLSFESSVIWLHDPETLPFVRVRVVRKCSSRGGKLLPKGGGRVVGYTKLTRDAPADPISGGFVRRVFYLRDEDLKTRRGDPAQPPLDAVDPKSVLPGVHGRVAVSRTEVKRQELTRRRVNKPRTQGSGRQTTSQAAEEEVLDWLSESMGPNLSSVRDSLRGGRGEQKDEALIDTQLAHDVPDPAHDDSAETDRPVAVDGGQLISLDGVEPIRLNQQELHIGRMADCDIELRGNNVSGVHCRLTLSGGYWFLEDLGSTNGTKLNGKRIDPNETRRMQPGDILGVGNHQFEIRYDPCMLGAPY